MVVAAFGLGLTIGLGVSTWLFRVYLRHHRRELKAAAKGQPVTVATEISASGSAPSPCPEASAGQATDDRYVDIPQSIVEQLCESLERLEVLERREQMRLVRREQRASKSAPRSLL